MNLKHKNQKNKFFKNFGVATLVHAVSKFLGSFREAMIVASFDKSVSDSFSAGAKIPSSVRRICGEGSIELASIPCISKLAAQKELEALWARKWQEVMLYISLLVCVIATSFMNFYDLGTMTKDIFIFNLQCVPIYTFCAFLVSAMHFNDYFAIPGLSQGMSNIIICSIISMSGAYESHYILCFSSLFSSIAYLIWNLFSISFLSITKRPVWVTNLRHFMLKTGSGFFVIFACFSFASRKALLLGKLLDGSIIFFALLLVTLICSWMTKDKSDHNYIFDLKPTFFRLTCFVLIVLILVEDMSLLNKKILNDVMVFCMLTIGAIVLKRLIKSEIRFDFYAAIFEKMDKNTLFNFKIGGAVSFLTAFLLLIYFPYAFLKMICVSLPLIHTISYCYYDIIYNSLSSEAIRNSSFGFFEAIGSSVFSSMSIQFVSISSTFMYTRMDKGIFSFSGIVDRTIQAPIGILSSALSATLLPRMSKFIKTGKLESAQKDFNSIISYLLVMSIPVILISYNLAGTLFGMIFSGTRRNEDDIINMVKMFKLEILALPFAILYKVCNIICFSVGMYRSSVAASWITSIICVFTKAMMLGHFPSWFIMAFPQTLAWFCSCVFLVIMTQFYEKNIDALDLLKKPFRKTKKIL